MNASLSILQKLKNQFFQGVSNKSEYHVAFAPFAFTLTNEDFYFLKNNVNSGIEAKRYLKEQSEFAHIANSVLKKPHIWSIDSDQLLYNLYRNFLNEAATIDPDAVTADEAIKIDRAKLVLFKPDGTPSDKYLSYKTYAVKYADIEKRLIQHNEKKAVITAGDIAANNLWTLDSNALNTERQDLLIEWQVSGAKSEIESAKATYDSIILSKNAFLLKWDDARNNKLLPPNSQTDEYGVDFLVTSCIPNAICNYQAPIWKKITIPKTEIAQLAQTFSQELPAEVITEFGNVETELDAISFDYCILDIQRPWFDESLLNSQNWNYRDTTILSQGDDSITGTIPAYPVKIILSKNIELAFTPGQPTNENLKNRLKNGDRVFFGSLLLKTIPLNMADDKISTYKVQQLSANQLSVLTKVAVQTTTATPKISDGSRFKMWELISHEKPQIMKQKVETKSVNPMRLDVAAKPPVATAVMSPKHNILGRRLFVRPEIFIGTHGHVTTGTTVPTTPPPALADIAGKIVDEQNLPVEIAEVQIMKTNTATTQSFLSLADGTYQFNDIEAGTYQFNVRKNGFITIEKSLEVKANANLDFLMTKQPELTESFQVMAVICKKLPKLPNPLPGGTYI